MKLPNEYRSKLKGNLLMNYAIISKAKSEHMQATVTDEYIKQILPTGKQYCIFILKSGPDRDHPDAEQIQCQHVRYLFQLRADGKLSISCPVTDGSEVLSVGILNTSDLKEAKAILNNDPNVKKGRLIYEIHPCFGLPGDSLAG